MRGQPQEATCTTVTIACAEESGQYALQGIYRAGTMQDELSEEVSGFIDCERTNRLWGEQVYVDKDLAKAANVLPGEEVRFNAGFHLERLYALSMEPIKAKAVGAAGSSTGDQAAEAAPQEAAPQKAGSEGQEERRRLWGLLEKHPQEAAEEAAQEPQEAAQEAAQEPEYEMIDADKLRTTSKGKTIVTDKIYMGVVKSVPRTKKADCGSIFCQEILNDFGYDVFTPANKLEGRNVGDTVCFKLGISSWSGKPQAVKVWLIAPAQPSNAKRARLEQD